MSCFLLPKALCSHIESIIYKFWWGNNNDKRKIHWIKWRQICKHKNKGGLGFRELKAFNEALLAKQGWRCITQPNIMIAQILKAKYYPEKSFVEAEIENKSVSYTWHSRSKANWILKKGVLWNIGNGANINIWNDNRLPRQQGALKFNVDAHLSGDGSWGLGWIVRREDGSWVGATTKVVRGIKEVAAAEARVLEAIKASSLFQHDS
ncbi:hypothetical protein TSUD_67340 [Trifolium subterraneum]|uniref:RNase H type-1 domain-containing protein n=1 Tax=Trifolium subterraneum TaxID=3900 RepID=A0A2Z6N565_TRISU|nr:hypothetical protein TSUD_67340 [Trifolium subterraneum]